MDDEQAIRELIMKWAAAVHAGDMDGVLTGHAHDIVMFDVPPPEQGVRGIDAYRATWPPFFDWQRSGGSFEIVELEVTAGDDVAFAWALLRCGTPESLVLAAHRGSIGPRCAARTDVGGGWRIGGVGRPRTTGATRARRGRRCGWCQR
jgi:ketosteroid isomerase-like protein